MIHERDNLPRENPDLETDPMLYIRVSHPIYDMTWYIADGAYCPERNDFICWGYVTLDGVNWEWGNISMRELEEAHPPPLFRLSG